MVVESAADAAPRAENLQKGRLGARMGDGEAVGNAQPLAHDRRSAGSMTGRAMRRGRTTGLIGI